MKTTIKTKTAGIITITSTYLGNDRAGWSGSAENWNNHQITIENNGKEYEFEFWASIVNPVINTDSDNINAFYYSLSDAISAKDSFEDFCSNVGYDEDSRKAEAIYKACEDTLSDVEGAFECDLYDLINEIQDTYEC